MVSGIDKVIVVIGSVVGKLTGEGALSLECKLTLLRAMNIFICPAKSVKKTHVLADDNFLSAAKTCVN